MSTIPPSLLETISENIITIIAKELNCEDWQVSKTVELLDGGATVPFIARYRKEITGALDDTQLRNLEERLIYLRELNERKNTILNSIESQGKLTDVLKAQIQACDNKMQLEDLYLAYKPKRRTKGQIAIEKGLEPLAQALTMDIHLDPNEAATAYIDPEKELTTCQEVLEGARYILMESLAEQPDIIQSCRALFLQYATLHSIQIENKKEKNPEASLKFKDYFDHQELLRTVPSHRLLAMLRGRNEGDLRLNVELPEDKKSIALGFIAQKFAFNPKNSARDLWLNHVVESTLKIKIHPHQELELVSSLREQAETEAINVFGHNLQDILMSPPAGTRMTLGIDPGFRSGIKLAIIDPTGNVLETATLYPHQPQNQAQKASAALLHLCQKYKIELISIGNGTASRETESFVKNTLSQDPGLSIHTVIVSEAGASVYSASLLAATEFPNLDVSLRGAISIAKRLQDPLAELVKIEPKAIGVGQYQHDVNQNKLNRMLNTVIEDCVNKVGVNVNTASESLLTQVAGLNKSIADNIVQYRQKNGPFSKREFLKQVPRLGPKAYEQAAGFLRILHGENPLDGSGVHPEAYPLVHKILKKLQVNLDELIANKTLLNTINPHDFIDEHFGLLTIQDVLKELEKPGHDPRSEFKTATFKEGINKISDLKPEMILEGVVTNVANFGAFVDIGVHQDGLVHISLLADRFVKDPRDVVKTGDIVKVKVIECDPVRKRISLSMRLHETAPVDQSAPADRTAQSSHRSNRSTQAARSNQSTPASMGTLGDLLKKALQ